MSLKVLSSVAIAALLATGCAGTMPVAPSAPAATATEPAPAPVLQAISDADLAALTDAQFAALSDLQVAALSQAQVASLSEARLAAMTPSQRVSILLTQFSALTIPQVKALPPALFAAMTPEQIRTLMPVHAQAMTPEQLAALSPEQAAAAAQAIAAPDDAEGPSKSLPPAPKGLTPGLYVNVIDGLINLSNKGGTQTFSTGQFGFTPSFSQPPVVVPVNPGIKFTPPPVFTAPTPAGGANAAKTNSPDCEVRYTTLTEGGTTTVVKKTYCN
jgi:hypothetical protein